MSEVDRLDPKPNIVLLSTGISCEIVPLKARQFFRLLRVLTHGAGPALLQNDLDFSGDQDQFLGKLLSLVLISIPDAENESIDFIQSMVKPVGLKETPLAKLSKEDKEANAQLWADLERATYNPELEDVIDIVEAIVKAEADDIQALGKRLGRLMELANKTGANKPEDPTEAPEPADLNSPESLSEESSPAPSTSSPASTDGKTKTSSTSRSGGSGKSRTPSAADEPELAGSSAS